MKIIKFPFKLLFGLISFIYSIKSLFFVIYKIKKDNIIFLQPEGGFGWTILTPEIFLRLYENDKYLLIFGFHPKRHNYEIKNLYTNFLWLDLTHKYFPNPVLEKFKYLVFFFLRTYLKLITIEHYNINDLWNEKKIDKFKNINHYNNDYFYPDNNTPVIFGINKKKKREVNYFNAEFDAEIKNSKYCGFLFRNKIGDINSSLRNMLASADDLSQIFELILSHGWKILVFGDIFQNIERFGNYNKKILFSQNFNISQNQYNLLAGLKSDCFIGPLSGGLNWKYIYPDKPVLILDAHPFGHSHYKSVMSYKILKKTSNDIKNINDLLNSRMYFHKRLDNVRDTNIEEKIMIINNFLINIRKLDNETLSSDKLKLKSNHPFFLSAATISKTWYQIQKDTLKKGN